MVSRLPVVKLADKSYALLRKITTGQKSIVWQAVQLTSEPDPEEFEHIVASGQELVTYLRKAQEPPGAVDSSGAPEGLLVALKVAKTRDDEPDLRKEAETLRGFLNEMWHQSRKAQVVRLVELDLPADDLPVMVLEWVGGVQLDRLPEPFVEREGLFLANQLASALIFIYGTRQLVPTDTLKPNSLFWDHEAESLVLTDWNVLGTPPEFRVYTLPIVGNTLHRILVGKTVDWVSDTYEVVPESVGGTPAWSTLTYGTVTLIRSALLVDFAGGDPGDLARQLSDAVKEQWELWDESPETLLKQASSERGEAAVRRYDLARAKQDGELDRGDEDRMVDELRGVIAGYAGKRQHAAALITLSWARARYPTERELRWAWLAHRVAHSDKSGSRKVGKAAMDALGYLNASKFEQAIAVLEATEGRPSPHLRALLAETQVWYALQIGGALTSEASVAQALYALVAAWDGFLGGAEAVADVRDAVLCYQESLGYVKREDLKAAKESLESLEAKAPEIPDLPRWVEAIDCLIRGRDTEALEVLHG
jgi:hypothetical protein